MTSTLPGEDWLRQVQARAVWTAIPTPAFTPTRVRASSFTICIKHFAMSRRKTSPMAMGRAPSPWHCDQASPGQNRSNGSAGTTLNQHQGDQPRQMFQCTVGHARGQLHVGAGPRGQKGACRKATQSSHRIFRNFISQWKRCEVRGRLELEAFARNADGAVILQAAALPFSPDRGCGQSQHGGGDGQLEGAPPRRIEAASTAQSKLSSHCGVPWMPAPASELPL